MRATWKPHDKQGRLTKRSDLPDSVFAYPAQRKEPMTSASHVRNALARFDQVEDVSGAERAAAFANIKKAAKHFDVEVTEKDWHELGSKPKGSKTASKKGARKKGPQKKAAKGSGRKAKKRAKKSKAPAKRKKAPTKR